MFRVRRPAWSVIGIIVLTFLLNVMIIKTAYGNNDFLLWMLMVSVPILIISIYNAWQTDHSFRKRSTNGMQPCTTESHFEWFSHPIYPNKITSTDLSVQIGNDQCSQPYNACIVNVKSMEDADLESTFINATSEQEPEYSKYSVVESLTTNHLAAGGLVWQIGPAYLGCRTENGHFNSEAFKIIAHRPEVKMIELKLSHGIFSDSAYTTFRDAEGMIHFLNNLRELSGGKPIGIRLCIKDKKEFYKICHAFRKTQLIPDFIVVEGYFESKRSIHSDQAFHLGIPLYDALLFVSQTLQIYRLQNKIRVIADGKIISSFDIMEVLALGANLVWAEVPPYTTIRTSRDGKKLSLSLKSQDVYDFHDNLMKDTVQLMNVCGFNSISDITLSKFFSRLDILYSKNRVIKTTPSGNVKLYL